jgi:eukaryotic-like serine/threonine-protein kinase
MLRGGAARTGSYPVTWNAPRRSWRYRAGAWIKSSPVVVDQTVYVCALDGTVHAVDALSGAPRWTVPSRGKGVDSSPVVAAGSVYVCDGHVHAFDAPTGDLRWKVFTGEQGASSPAFVDGLVIVGGPRWTLLALDAETGELRWTRRIEACRFPGLPGSPPDLGAMESSPAVADGTIYATGGGRLHALEAGTGQLKWSADVRCSPMASPAVSAGAVYVTEGSGVCAVQASDGYIRWRTDVDSVMFRWGTVAVSGGTVLAGGELLEPGGALGSRISGGVLVALDAATGAIRWRYLTESGVEASPAAADGVAYLATRGNSRHAARLTALDVISGSLHWWRWLPSGDYSGVVSSPAVAGGRVYLGLPNGELLAVPADGESDRSSLLGRLNAWLRRSERARLTGLLRSEPLAAAAAGLAPDASLQGSTAAGPDPRSRAESAAPSDLRNGDGRSGTAGPPSVQASLSLAQATAPVGPRGRGDDAGAAAGRGRRSREGHAPDGADEGI